MTTWWRSRPRRHRQFSATPSYRLIPDGENRDSLTRRRWLLIWGETGGVMRESFEAQATAFAQAPRLTAYSITATFGDGQPGRVNERVVDKRGKFHFDTMTWKAGDIAYQFFKERFPEGITDSQFLSCCQEWVLLVCDDFYPIFLSRVEDCSITLYPQDLDGLVEAWKRYDWCERAMLMIEFGDVVNRGIDSYDEIDSFFSPLIALVLLQRLDDAVIAEFLDGSGPPRVTILVASIEPRTRGRR